MVSGHVQAFPAFAGRQVRPGLRACPSAPLVLRAATKPESWRTARGLPAHLAFRGAFDGQSRRFLISSCRLRQAGSPATGRRALMYAGAAIATGATLFTLATRHSFAGGIISFSEAILPPTSGHELDLLNGDPRVALKDKPMKELLRSWMVYRLCSFPWLAGLAPRLLAFAEKLHCAGIIHWVAKHTFFRHFCGGETIDEVVQLMRKMGASNVGVILDLSVEADVNMGSKTNDATIRKMINDRADKLRDVFQDAITAASAQEKTFVAVKVSALGSPDLLLKMSKVLADVRRLFVEADEDRDGKISRAEFGRLAASLGEGREVTSARAAAIDRFFAAADRDADGTIDYIDLTDALSFESGDFTALMFAAGESITPLTHDDIEDVSMAMDRLDYLCASAASKGVRLMVDAEQTYLQPAIDHAALKMQHKYNAAGTDGGSDPIVYNTYQLYLKDGLPRLKQDYERAIRSQWRFAAKLVRGAYMVGEARYAQELGIPDPVLPSIDATHASYHAGVDFLLDKIAGAARQGKRTPALFMVASHNHQTIARTCSEMDRLSIPRRDATVMFGQLLGMQDHVTYTLATNGFASYKYIPFGPVKDVIPYLLRRATENSSVMSGATVELTILSKEIKRRIRQAVGLPPPPPLVRVSGQEAKR